MLIVIIIAIVFVMMLTAPILLSTIYYKTKPGEILRINQNRVRNPRHFGMSFSTMVESQLPYIDDYRIKLSKEEEIFDYDTRIEYVSFINKIVIELENEVSFPENITDCSKEIYSAYNASFLHSGLTMRAVYSKENIRVGDGIEIIRWIDAEKTVAVYDNCSLGMSASAGEKMSIGHGCKFHRLYAPKICIGQYPENEKDPLKGRNRDVYFLSLDRMKKKRVRYIRKDMVDEKGILNASVLAWHNVKILENIIIQGDVRSQKGVRLCDGAVVCGNIFAEGNIILGKGTTVLGCVFSQRSIIAEDDVSIGVEGKICSVIARENISFGINSFVYGYVSCEREGMVKERTGENDEIKKEYRFVQKEEPLHVLSFACLEDYENQKTLKSRQNKELRQARIPDGANEIYKSMFFNCPQLEKVVLPIDLEVINDYAFAECIRLEKIYELSNTKVVQIGTSAFENCKTIKEIQLPKTIQRIKGAAFAGCENLERVVFDMEGNLEYLEDHVFRGCKSLTEIELPNSIKYVGVSAFKDCVKLKKIVIPKSCEGQLGIQEIIINNPDIELVIRPDDLSDCDEENV